MSPYISNLKPLGEFNPGKSDIFSTGLTFLRLILLLLKNLRFK